ncbi:MAG: hypothetical protein KBS99_05100 [Prevotellaceae bacterium]|nr:hypothetical protein [Candidatus Colivivens caballi]
MTKIYTLIFLLCYGVAAGAQELHPCDANHDGAVDVTDIAAIATYILTGEYEPSTPPAHEGIDLGLPSGLKWASCNVGADKPEDYGYYLAWGESSEKVEYNSSTYFDLDNGHYQKYTERSAAVVLDSVDDAAHVNWGGNWRMPTREDVWELMDNCDWSWETLNGVNGCRIKSRTNGNSIFLPAAGEIQEKEYNGIDIAGRYWTSTLSGGYPYYLAFYQKKGSTVEKFCSSRTTRTNGLPVRPVCP